MKCKFWMAAFLAAAFLLGGCGTPTVKTIETKTVKAPLILTMTVTPEALFSMPVIPQVSGSLLAPLPDIGTELHAGDVICDIDTSLYDAQIAEAQNQIAETPVVSSASDADSDGSMEASLLRQGIITRAEYDKLRGKKSAVRNTHAGNEALEAALAAAKNARAACHITAPIDGIVAKIYTKEAVANAGKPLLLIRQDSPVSAEIEIPQDMVAMVDEAKEKRTLTVALTDKKQSRVWFGELKKETEDTGGHFSLYRVQVDNPDGAINFGDAYELRIDTGRETEGVVVPATALMDGNQVQVVTADGLLDIRTVIVGSAVGDNKIIIGGLSEGERVVVSPDPKLAVGTKVKVR